MFRVLYGTFEGNKYYVLLKRIYVVYTFPFFICFFLGWGSMITPEKHGYMRLRILLNIFVNMGSLMLWAILYDTIIKPRI